MSSKTWKRFEMNKTCWNCKYFTHTGGHGSHDWGNCNLINGYKDAEETCDKFIEKVTKKMFGKNEYEIKTAINEWDSLYPCEVVVYWNGEEIETKKFNSIDQAGDFVQKVEAFLKYRKY
jgi:hypothetical protein